MFVHIGKHYNKYIYGALLTNIAYQQYKDPDTLAREYIETKHFLTDLRSLIKPKTQQYVKLFPKTTNYKEQFKSRTLSELLRDNGYGIGDFPQIIDIDASNCELKRIYKCDISLFYILLNIDDNHQFSNLHKINLSNNELTGYYLEAPKLKDLNLSNNKLRYMLWNNDNIKYLNLSNNKVLPKNMKDIIDFINELKKLEYLDIRGTNINSTEILTKQNLTVLTDKIDTEKN